MWKTTSAVSWPGVVSYILERACHRPLRFVTASKEKMVRELGNDVRRELETAEIKGNW